MKRRRCRWIVHARYGESRRRHSHRFVTRSQARAFLRIMRDHVCRGDVLVFTATPPRRIPTRRA